MNEKKKYFIEEMETSTPQEPPKEIRVWCDGCYDVTHFGHANSMRQAKALGHKLVVGVHSDEEVATHKRPPVYTEKERIQMIESIKWVDEVVGDAPYVTNLEVLDKYKCDFSVHGDDLTMTADGSDTYHLVKEANRYKQIARTAGISTTDLVKRMLPKNKDILTTSSPWTGDQNFLLSTEKISQFSSGKTRKPTDKVVYVCGAFDVLHVGHVDFLSKAKEQGDYVIVGLHPDEIVTKYKGNNYPIMNLHERVLNVLSCKYVDDVIIGAPFTINADLMEQFNVDVVCHGQLKISDDPDLQDPYSLPKKMGKFVLIDSGNTMTTEEIVERIIRNRMEYENRNVIKEKKETEAFEAFQCTNFVEKSCTQN